MQQSNKAKRNLAMLIDGDNAQHSLVKQMLEESSRYGDVTIRRAYGDWTQPNLANWRPVMLAHAIQPMQQWRYTTGKNATDSALIIDAMDILYSDKVQGFCIISTDSDYTRLCTRIRESGLFVMGIGKQQTHEAFVNACHVFIYVETLVQPNEDKHAEEAKIIPIVEKTEPIQTKSTEKADPPTTLETPKSVKVVTEPIANIKSGNVAQTPTSSEKILLNLLKQAFDLSEKDQEGWVYLGALGSTLHRINPKFDPRTYGFKSLSLLVQSMPKKITIKGINKTGKSTSSVYVHYRKE